MKVSFIILVALALTVALRHRSAALRHWVLAAAIGCAAVTPALELLVPSWQLPLSAPASIQRMEETTRPAAGTNVPRRRSVSAVGPDVSESPRVGMVTAIGLVGPIWIGGVAISLFVLFVGLARLAWLASRARCLDGGRWSELVDEMSRECGLRRPVLLLQSEHPSLLVTWGLVRSKIILPAGASDWPEDLMRIVLCHELAHIRRGDWIVQMAGELLRSIYWFNPILWVACRRLRLESEHACDDAVLSRGVEGSRYATHLIDLARALNQRRTWFPAPAMARPSSLERRISAMLNDRLNRNPLSRSARFAIVIALVIITVGVAAAQVFATFSGSVVDPQGAFLPNAKLVLTNAERQAKYEVTSNRFGQFEFVGLPPGDYTFEAQLPGFATFRQALRVDGQSIQRGIMLQLGMLEESITVTDGPPTNRRRIANEPLAPRANPPCPASPQGGSIPTGGNVRPPHKLRDVPPHYPESLSASGTGGVVIMEGRIGLDGFPRDLALRNEAPPELVNAVINAVSQWQFDSTLLNCVAVEPAIRVTTRFIHQP